MTWTQFLLFLTVAYIVYYMVIIIMDKLSSGKTKGVREEVLEIVAHENIAPVDIGLTDGSEEISSDSEWLNDQEQTYDELNDRVAAATRVEDVAEPFVEQTATGGIKVKNLFKQYKDWSKETAENIAF